MKITIYPLLRTESGRACAETPVAEVSIEGGSLDITCSDGALRERLGEIFSAPLTARAPLGPWPEIFSWKTESIRPLTRAFFREIVYSLRKYGLYGVYEE